MRLVTRSDFDGLACAALLKEAGIIDHWKFAHPKDLQDGLVEIKSVSREAGSRTKIAVYSEDADIDAQGSCIGPRGSRVQAIGDELNYEKIDIVKWSEDPVEYISAARSPSKVLTVDINEEEKSA